MMLHEYSGLMIGPCPFCAYDGQRTTVSVDYYHGQKSMSVECGWCGAFGPPTDYEEDEDDKVLALMAEAINRWNRRAELPKPPAPN